MAEAPAKTRYVRSLTRKGQVTVPKAVRDLLALEPGAAVSFEVDEQRRVTVKRAALSLDEIFGSVPPLTKPEDFERLRDEAIEEHVSREFGKDQERA